ncbi:MAG: CatA-like O-acetyltransferase, partial [Bacteroidales bacterium]
LTPIKINDDGKFVEVLIPYVEDFEEFHQKARSIINNIPKDATAYGIVNENQQKEEVNNGFILLSALPDLYFTSITSTQQFRHGGNFPLINAGKAIMRDGHMIMPIGMTLHHGFVDGFHITQFFKKVENFLK